MAVVIRCQTSKQTSMMDVSGLSDGLFVWLDACHTLIKMHEKSSGMYREQQRARDESNNSAGCEDDKKTASVDDTWMAVCLYAPSATVCLHLCIFLPFLSIHWQPLNNIHVHWQSLSLHSICVCVCKPSHTPLSSLCFWHAYLCLLASDTCVMWVRWCGKQHRAVCMEEREQ